MIYFSSFDLVILFFVLGALASWVKSDLEVPESISKFLSIFLLLSLGLKGGHEVRIAENLNGFFPVLIIGLTSCLAIPSILYWTLRSRLGFANAAALAASYGSVSAVTFVATQGILTNENLAYSGYMVAIMALMEIPAILMAVFFHQMYSGRTSKLNQTVFVSIFSAKSVVLLLGGFAIGLSMNQTSWDGIAPVVQGCFKGVLAFFLLDLGVIAQKQLREAWAFKVTAILVAVVLPLVFGSIALAICHWVGISQGDQILTAVLVGSASYIAAPAAIRSTIKTANPSLYLALPLALTFPMNLILGIPFYIEISHLLTSSF
jgi:hypothetical protein